MFFVWTQIPNACEYFFLRFRFSFGSGLYVQVQVHISSTSWVGAVSCFEEDSEIWRFAATEKETGPRESVQGIGFGPRHGHLHDQASLCFLPPVFFESFHFSFRSLLSWVMFDISLLHRLPGSDEVSGYVV